MFSENCCFYLKSQLLFVTLQNPMDILLVISLCSCAIFDKDCQEFIVNTFPFRSSNIVSISAIKILG